jgi:hypothetical protein
MHQNIVSNYRPALSDGEKTRIWQTALDALSDGDINQALNQFGDRFTFSDHPLGIGFKEKERMREYFVRSPRFSLRTKKGTDHILSSTAHIRESETESC